MSKEDLQAFGRRLRALRERQGFQQKDLEERIGAKPNKVSNWELGYSYPQARAIIKLAHALSCSSDELLGIEPIRFSDHAYSLLKRIEQLDEAGIHTVEAVIDSQLRRLGDD